MEREQVATMATWANDQPEMQLFIRMSTCIGMGTELPLLTVEELDQLHRITGRLSYVLSSRWDERRVGTSPDP
jgi:hypothetical protein